MSNLIKAILGVIVGWAIYGFITNNFSIPFLFCFIFALAIGYDIGKKEKQQTKDQPTSS